MDLTQKIMYASLQVDKGCSLKDFLEDWEIEEAVRMLADVLVVTGNKLPEEEDD